MTELQHDDWRKVRTRRLIRYLQNGHAPSVLAEYTCHDETIYERVSPEDPKTAPRFRAWWLEHSDAEPVPETVSEVLSRIGELRATKEVRVVLKGRRWVITGRKLWTARRGPKRPEVGSQGKAFGHDTHVLATGIIDDYRFADNDEPVWRDSLAVRKCLACGLHPTPQGYDPCLGKLPGVKNACCGHGQSDGYIMFKNGKIVRGRLAVDRVTPTA